MSLDGGPTTVDEDSGGWNPDTVPPHTDDDARGEAWDLDLPPPSAYRLNGNGAHPTDDDGTERTSWWPLDLSGLFDGSTEPPEPTMFCRTDGLPILYPGKVHAFNGESESGKSWAALLPCVEQINAGNHVWYLDFEDDASTLVARLLALGAKPGRVLAHLHYAMPSEPLAFKGRYTGANTELAEALERWAPTLAVIDGVTEAMTLHGLDLNSNQDYATFHGLLPRRLSRAGSSVIDIDHVTKDRETRSRYAIGAQHKLAGMDGAVFSFEVIRPFGLGLHGVARLVIQKDRPGQLRRHAVGKGVIAEFHLESDPETHAVKAYLEPPPSEAELEDARDRKLMEAVSHWLAMNPGEHSQAEIRRNVKGGHDAILAAVDALCPDYATRRKQGQAWMVGHVELYRGEDE